MIIDGVFFLNIIFSNFYFFYFCFIYLFNLIGSNRSPYFFFGNDKVVVWEFITNPKNSISCTGSNIVKFVAKPRCCNRKITESLYYFLKSIYSRDKLWHLPSDVSKLRLRPLITLWIFWELLPDPSISTGTRTSFLPKETVLVFVDFCVEERWSIHPSGLFCTCNPVFGKRTSDSANLPSWSVCSEWTDSCPSNLWLVGFHHRFLFCWSVTNGSKIPLLSDKIWNGALFQHCLHSQIYLFLLLLN